MSAISQVNAVHGGKVIRRLGLKCGPEKSLPQGLCSPWPLALDSKIGTPQLLFHVTEGTSVKDVRPVAEKKCGLSKINNTKHE